MDEAGAASIHACGRMARSRGRWTSCGLPTRAPVDGCATRAGTTGLAMHHRASLAGPHARPAGAPSWGIEALLTAGRRPSRRLDAAKTAAACRGCWRLAALQQRAASLWETRRRGRRGTRHPPASLVSPVSTWCRARWGNVQPPISLVQAPPVPLRSDLFMMQLHDGLSGSFVERVSFFRPVPCRFQLHAVSAHFHRVVRPPDEIRMPGLAQPHKKTCFGGTSKTAWSRRDSLFCTLNDLHRHHRHRLTEWVLARALPFLDLLACRTPYLGTRNTPASFSDRGRRA